MPTYPGPKTLSDALSALRIERGTAFRREGLRADSEYRDLGLAAATGGRLGAKHIRAAGRFEAPTGWHWHDMQAHFIYVLKGWITFHNVIARSDDFEVLELNVPAEYGTFELPGRP